jgi:branched-chain amino acid transport system ATP-binding protein
LSPDAQPDIVLKLTGVEAAYGRIQALNGIDLEVRRGQIVALLGANGAGKTTTLKAISGLVRPHTGSITLEGREIVGMKAHDIARLGIVHVPEGRRILRGLTVRENLEVAAFSVRSVTLRRERMEEVFRLFPLLKRRQSQDGALLSGGEQQMLAIGRALMQGPHVLLLDEPSMGLAPKLVLETLKIVKRLNQEEGTTILLVEQNARLALKLAHYGYVLEGGRICMRDEAARLREDNSIVQAYLGGGG